MNSPISNPTIQEPTDVGVQLEDEVSLSSNSMGERIRNVRNSWGWSQGDMADALRVDQASISFWERGKIKPSGSAMVALAALFRTSVEALETGQGFVLPDPPSRFMSMSAKSDRDFPRSISLPRVEGDTITIVDLADGSSKGRDISEAMMMFMEAVKRGRKVWVVLE